MAVNQIKGGIALSYTTIVVHMLVGLLYTPYMLRMLGKSEYGIYSLAASVIAYLTVLDLGFGNAIVRYTAKFRAEGRKREQQEMFGMFLILYLIIGLIALICGAILSFNVENIFSKKFTDNELARTEVMMWLMTFNLALTFPMSIWGSIMTAYEKFVFQRIVGLIRTVLNPLAMVLLLFYGHRAIAMVVVTTIFNVVTLIINYWYCKHNLHIGLRFGKFKLDFLKEVSVYSFWIFLESIMNRVYWGTGQFILGIFCGASAIAVYAVAITFQNYYMQFSTAISGVFLPKVTAMVVNGESDKSISDLFIKSGRVQYIVLIFILSYFILFGKPFIRLWAGTGYDETYVITLLFFIPLTIPLIQNMGITILQARNQMAFRSIIYVSISILCVILAIPMAKYNGPIGCAAATSFSLTLGQIIVMNIYYKKKQCIDIRSFWVQIGKMSILPLVLAFGGWVLFHFLGINLENPLTFLITSLLFVMMYFPLFWRFSMNEYERNLILKPIKKSLGKL